MYGIRSITSLAGLFLVLAPAAPADEAHALLDRALRAHGGKARLERTKKGRLKAEWKGQWNGVFHVVWEETFDLPARCRTSIDGTVNERPFHQEAATNGGQSWFRAGTEPPRDVPPEEPLPVEQHWHTILVQLLILDDKDVQLASLPDETREGRTLAGLRATSPHTTVDLYFDKSTALLARARRPLPNFLPGQERIGETVYDAYQTIQDIRYPMRFQASAGNDYSFTVSISSLQFLDAIDDGVFAKPETPSAAAEPSPPASTSNEEKPTRWLIVATLSAGVVVGAMWFLVRASKRRKQETPSS